MADFHYIPDLSAPAGDGSAGNPWTDVATLNAALASGALGTGDRLLIAPTDATLPQHWIAEPIYLDPAAGGLVVKSGSATDHANLHFGVLLSSSVWSLVSGNVYQAQLSTSGDRHRDVTVWEIVDASLMTRSLLQAVAGASPPTATLEATPGSSWVNNSTGELYVHAPNGGDPTGLLLCCASNGRAGLNNSHGLVFGDAAFAPIADVEVRRLRVSACGLHDAGQGSSNWQQWAFGGGASGLIAGCVLPDGGSSHNCGWTRYPDSSSLAIEGLDVGAIVSGAGPIVFTSGGSDNHLLLRNVRVPKERAHSNTLGGTQVANSPGLLMHKSTGRFASVRVDGYDSPHAIQINDALDATGGVTGCSIEVANSTLPTARLHPNGGEACHGGITFRACRFTQQLVEVINTPSDTIVSVEECDITWTRSLNVPLPLSGKWSIRHNLIEVPAGTPGGLGVFAAGASDGLLSLIYVANAYAAGPNNAMLFGSLDLSKVVSLDRNRWALESSNARIVKSLDRDGDGTQDAADLTVEPKVSWRADLSAESGIAGGVCQTYERAADGGQAAFAATARASGRYGPDDEALAIPHYPEAVEAIEVAGALLDHDAGQADALRVVDASGNPLAGAEIELHALAGYNPSGVPLSRTTTGADGRWLGALGVEDGTYALIFLRPTGYRDPDDGDARIEYRVDVADGDLTISEGLA